MTIREVLKNLRDNDQEKYKQIMNAFNKMEALIVQLDNGVFIGVHLTSFENLTVSENVGAWCVGSLTC